MPPATRARLARLERLAAPEIMERQRAAEWDAKAGAALEAVAEAWERDNPEGCAAMLARLDAEEATNPEREGPATRRMWSLFFADAANWERGRPVALTAAAVEAVLNAPPDLTVLWADMWECEGCGWRPAAAFRLVRAEQKYGDDWPRHARFASELIACGQWFGPVDRVCPLCGGAVGRNAFRGTLTPRRPGRT